MIPKMPRELWFFSERWSRTLRTKFDECLGEMHRNEMIATFEHAPARFRSLASLPGLLMIGYIGLKQLEADVLLLLFWVKKRGWANFSHWWCFVDRHFESKEMDWWRERDELQKEFEPNDNRNRLRNAFLVVERTSETVRELLLIERWDGV